MRFDRSSFRRAAEIGLAALLPADCLLCGDPLPWRQRGSVCPFCWSSLPWAPGIRPRAGALSATLWGADYDGPIRDLIHAFKFEGLDYLGRPLGQDLAGRIAPLLGTTVPRPELIVPVPLHWWRRLRRGFNQAHLLAAAMARRTGLPLRPRLLVRRHPGRRQVGSSRSDRLLSLDACFDIARGRGPARALGGRRVILIDDVMTTGATLTACARVLLGAGARSVIGCALARTPRAASAAGWAGSRDRGQ